MEDDYDEQEEYDKYIVDDQIMKKSIQVAG